MDPVAKLALWIQAITLLLIAFGVSGLLYKAAHPAPRKAFRPRPPQHRRPIDWAAGLEGWRQLAEVTSWN
jgi:hypothetical protein